MELTDKNPKSPKFGKFLFELHDLISHSMWTGRYTVGIDNSPHCCLPVDGSTITFKMKNRKLKMKANWTDGGNNSLCQKLNYTPNKFVRTPWRWNV